MYEIPSLQYFQLSSLEEDSKVYIELPQTTITYEITKMVYGWFLSNQTNPGKNDEIFKELGIDSPKNFVKNIVGYAYSGMFPEIETNKDLLKVIVALDKECIKKFGNKNEQSEFKDGDYISIMHNDELLWIMIFKQRSGDTIYRYANYSDTTKNLYLDEDGYITLSSSRIMRYATEEEQKILDYELFKKGLVWNDICKTLVPINTIAIDSCETKATISDESINISYRDEIFKNYIKGTLAKPKTPIELYQECIKESEDKTMSTFHIGDRVKIKPRTKSPEEYHPCYTLSMTKYAGRIAKVTNVTSTDFVVLDIDDGQSYWAPEILEKVTNNEFISTDGLIIYKEQDLAKFLKSAVAKQTESEKINLFPTKKHYKFNFSIN